MKSIYKTAIIATFFLFGFLHSSLAQEIKYSDAWSSHGISLADQNQAFVQLNFSLEGFIIEDLTVEGEPMKNILVPEIFLPNDEGAPNLPEFSKRIAIPQGATAKVKIVDFRIETIHDIEIAPAPRIPLETEDGPLFYKKDSKIYSKDEFYPLKPVILSEPGKLRGVDFVMIGISPFQYNPVTKELKITRDIRLEVEFIGGNGHFGEDRLRSRWWDPIVKNGVINPGSLPEIDFNKKHADSKSPDYEYLVIVPNSADFIQWADSIKNWRTLQGIKTGVVTTTEIGGNTVSAIETYVDNAYNTWDVPPSAVLLLADYGTGTTGIISQFFTHPAGYPNFVSDNQFADVNGDNLPEIAFARITANDASQLDVMVTKFLDYERNPPSSYDFYDHPITALGWQTERWFQLCSEIVGGYFKNELGKNPVRINAIYSGTPGSDWSTAPNTSEVVGYFGPSGLGYIPATPAELGGWSGGTATDVVNAINAGSFMLQHRDHGSYTGWGEPAFQSSNINSLTNVNNRLPYIFSVNCQTGAFHISSETFAEKFHRHTYGGQNSGALGVMAATEVSYSFVNDAYLWGVMDNMFPDFMGYTTTFPVSYVMPAFGNAAGKHFLYSTQWPYNEGDKLITYRLFHHHGDAFMTVYTEVPQNLSVTHDPAILGGSSSFTVSANAGSLIALTVNGEIIGTADGTGSPVAITITPPSVGDEMIVTVTKQNYYRYQQSVEVVPASGPYVSYDSHQINDAAGNNNGQADFGENILLDMTLENVGSSPASAVNATLICTDPYVTVNDNYATFGTINNGSIVTVEDAYGITLANNIPDQYTIDFELQITGTADDTWTSYFSIFVNAPSFTYGEMTIDDVSGGNGNGKLDPNETANIIIEITNSGHSTSPAAIAYLTTASPYLTVNTGTQNYSGIASGTTVYPTFNISVSSAAPAGTSVNLNSNIVAGSYTANASYNTVVGQIPVLILDLDDNASSGPYMQTAMTNLGVGYDYSTSFPGDLNLYSSVFVCLGIYANNYVLSSAQGTTLANYLNNGGTLYMEGGDTWAYDSQTAVHSMFNIDGQSDGSADMGTVVGIAGTFTEGMSFTYSGENSWMDRLGATSPAYVVLQNVSPSYGTAVAYDAGTYKTIGASHEFGGLTDASSPSTKTELMEEYLTFFGVLGGATFPQISVDPHTLNFGGVEVGSSATLQFTIENTGTGVLTGTITTPTGFTVAQAKDYGDNTLSYAVAEGMTEEYNLTFSPTAVQSYIGNVTIEHNAGGAAELISVSGNGLAAPMPDISVNPSNFYVTLMQDDNTDRTLIIDNLGDANLNYSSAVSYLSKGMDIGSQINTGTLIKHTKKSLDQEECPYKAINYSSPEAVGDILMDMDIQTITGEDQLLGCGFDGTYLWFTGGGGTSGLYANQLYKVDVGGNLIGTYSQGTSSDWGIRDLAFDGTYLYGGDENGFYRIDPSTGTVTTMFTGNLGLTCIRALTYNMVNGHFYACNWDTQIVEFSSSGTTYGSYTASGLASIYGLAYDVSTGNLWLYDRTGSPETSFYEYSLSTQSLTGYSIQVSLLSGLTSQMNGGAFYSTDLVSGKIILGGVVQGTDNDKFFAMEIGDLATYSWLSVTNNASGTVNPGNSLNVTVHFDAIGLDAGIYEGAVVISSNDPDQPQLSVPCTLEVISGTETNISAFLEGPFLSTEMTTDLNTLNTIPLNQPYNVAPWNYTGSENVAAIPNTDVVDWILVELRETAGGVATATPATIIGQQAGFILKDGAIVSIDGNSPMVFDVMPTQNVFTVVYHRNHLGIQSATAMTSVGNVYSFDFTTGQDQVYGSEHAHKQLSAGIWGMAGGNANADCEINNLDKNDVWVGQLSGNGYYSGDFNMDGAVDMNDKYENWETNSGKCSYIVK
ncbi:MAG: choice-of-anchor D domain-containing protein [Bacteroidales bacterium]|nr:choice-of-anchor D domain-containing protein [Bacteroidales bacterium]